MMMIFVINAIDVFEKVRITIVGHANKYSLRNRFWNALLFHISRYCVLRGSIIISGRFALKMHQIDFSESSYFVAGPRNMSAPSIYILVSDKSFSQ